VLGAAARGEIGLDRRFLHAVLDRPAEAVPDLLRFAAEDYARYPVNLEDDLVFLFRALDTPQALPFYIAILRENPVDPPDHLIEAVAHLGAAALEPLLELYAILDEEESADIAFLLSGLGVRDPRILEILLDRLEYDALDGAVSLELYGDPAAIPAIRKILDQPPPPDAAMRHALSSAIEALETPAETHPGDNYDIWSLYPEEAPPDFDLLSEESRIEALANASAEFRAAAAHSFFNREYSIPARARLLEVARNDESPEVRARCWEALLDASGEAEVRKSMLAVLADPEAPDVEKGGALVGLSQESELPAVARAMETLYRRPETRAKALEAMWRSLDRSWAQYFPAHLDDADLDTQRAAIWGVGYLGIQAEAGRLEEFFEDDDLRSEALFAYALAAPAEVSRGRIRALYRRIDTLAGGLSAGEEDLVKLALDERLTLHGMKPVFHEDDEDEEAESGAAAAPAAAKAGRNDPCPCGSGKKFKKCCGAPAA
jgi:hypothetical protein